MQRMLPRPADKNWQLLKPNSNSFHIHTEQNEVKFVLQTAIKNTVHIMNKET